jgi:uncharacterized protein (DUF433 family)
VQTPALVERDDKAIGAELLDTIPLSKDEIGVYRIGGTRVTLDLIIRAFNRGATAEEIVQDFPSLQLSDIYQVIGCSCSTIAPSQRIGAAGVIYIPLR